MNSKMTIKPVLTSAALVVSFACTQASAEISIDGNVEIDTTAQFNSGGGDGEDFTQGGRVQLNASGTQNVGSATLAGRGTINLGKDGGTSVDDAWFSLGQGIWNVKFGRFEALETFQKGVDTVLNVIGQNTDYTGNAVRGRSGGDVGQIALDITPNDRVFLQLGTFFGEIDGGDDDQAFSGIRPAIQAVITDDLNITASYEFLDVGGVETDGASIYVRYATAAFALKMNAAFGSTEDVDHTTFNVNLESGNYGIGYHTTEDEGDGIDDTSDTVYARYLIPNLMGSENTNAQLALSYATADSAEEDETAIRLRFFHSF